MGAGHDTRSCTPPGVDCGSSEPAGGPNSTYAKVTRSGDDLYLFIHVKDDFQSYAVKPSECVAHWLADSVEILIDPRGSASQALKDTANTFKLGVFPFTDDPTGSNGNGPNGPCWERDADNHQGYATGPLAATVPGAPNAPGVEVASTATWVGSNETTTPHAYAGGGYELEVKIPLADLPAAVDPDHMGLNITPYDEDDTAAAGTTTLRHIDQSTRLAWSTFGSVQSDPYRWGHATLPGYTPPAGRPTDAPPPTLTPALNGVDSPQTIAQSARDNVPISGRDPAPRSDRIAAATTRLHRHSLVLDLRTTGAGRVHVFLWSGDDGLHPRVPDLLLDHGRPAAGLRPDSVRSDRWRQPTLGHRHERADRRPAPAHPGRRGAPPGVDPADRGQARSAGPRRLRAGVVRDTRRRCSGAEREAPTTTLIRSGPRVVAFASSPIQADGLDVIAQHTVDALRAAHRARAVA